jgi:predicted Ser/Thr protein kinase
MKALKPITKRFSVNESKFLGKGCFGNVYEGYDTQANKVIAVKHLITPQNF